MGLEFAVQARKYVVEIDNNRFLDLLDSESYVTGNAALSSSNKTLDDKLREQFGIEDVDYDGHFGAAITMTIQDEDDSPELREKIAQVIADHLSWCALLPKRADVIARRA